MQFTMLALIYFIITQITPGQTASPESDLMLKIFIPTGAVSGTFSIIWYYLVRHLLKQNQKQFEFALQQNQKQSEAAQKQNQDQFDKALSQIEKQHKENLDESRRTNDKLFDVIRKDTEYKEILAGVLKGIEIAIDRIQEKI
ncbi:MAG: hypothetical protein FIA82_00360 [Melioribacter sp.]|nr:hypothetical protein [Melioribacter sp.]